MDIVTLAGWISFGVIVFGTLWLMISPLFVKGPMKTELQQMMEWLKANKYYELNPNRNPPGPLFLRSYRRFELKAICDCCGTTSCLIVNDKRKVVICVQHNSEEFQILTYATDGTLETTEKVPYRVEASTEPGIASGDDGIVR